MPILIDNNDENSDWIKKVRRMRAAGTAPGEQKAATAPILIDDSEENADWIKTDESKAEAQAALDALQQGGKSAPEPRRGALDRIRDSFLSAGSALAELLGGGSADTKEDKYQVQPFHGGFGKEESKGWSFSAADGNAILDKGGWPMYKRAHLVVNVSDGNTPENKSAYVYPVAKLVDGKLTYFLKAAQSVYSGLRGGGRGAKLPGAIDERALAALKKVYAAFGKDVEQMELKSDERRELPTPPRLPTLQERIEQHSKGGGVAFAFKGEDGRDWWLQFTTNAFQDREGEYFRTKTLEDFVESMRGKKKKGEFWYRHIPGTKFGDVLWQAMIGRFLAQAGPFDDTSQGRAFKEFFNKYPDGHPAIAKEGWGTSHGYSYNSKDREDGIYDWCDITESTVLPLRVASNPWSPHPRIVRRHDMNEQERKELEAIGGKAFADLVAREGEQRTKELESRVGYKALTKHACGSKDIETAMAKLMAMIEAVDDPDLKAGLTDIHNELSSEGGEMATGEEGFTEEEAAAEEDMLEEGMASLGGRGKKYIEESAVEDALIATVTQLRAEMEASQKQLLAALSNVATPLATAIGRLQDQEAAEKARNTPAASLMQTVNSVLNNEKAVVPEGDPLAGKKPEESKPRPASFSAQGLPSFLADMFGENE